MLHPKSNNFRLLLPPFSLVVGNYHCHAKNLHSCDCRIGTSMGQMQVHSCLLFLIIVCSLPCSNNRLAEIAHICATFEITSLCATIFALWAASVFNTYPRCEAGDGPAKLRVVRFHRSLVWRFWHIAAAPLLFIIAFKVINPVADGLQKSGKLMSSWRQHVSHV